MKAWHKGILPYTILIAGILGWLTCLGLLVSIALEIRKPIVTVDIKPDETEMLAIEDRFNRLEQRVTELENGRVVVLPDMSGGKDAEEREYVEEHYQEPVR